MQDLRTRQLISKVSLVRCSQTLLSVQLFLTSSSHVDQLKNYNVYFVMSIELQVTKSNFSNEIKVKTKQRTGNLK